MDSERIRIGISSCLIGEAVRYNGGHKRDAYVSEVLSKYFEYVPFCPEVAIGLGVPRATLQLRSTRHGTRAIQADTPNRDVTGELAAYGREIGARHKDLSGYIFKARSPSCGTARVKVYDRNGVPSASGPGIYAQAFKELQPLLPTEDEGRLNDPGLRDNFIERVFVYRRWQQMLGAGFGAAALIRFHSEHQFLIMTHSRTALRELGRMIANLKGDVDGIAAAYFERLMQALVRRAARGNLAGALQHSAGTLGTILDSTDRRELADAISAYQKQELPIIVPLSLIERHLRRLSPKL